MTHWFGMRGFKNNVLNSVKVYSILEPLRIVEIAKYAVIENYNCKTQFGWPFVLELEWGEMQEQTRGLKWAPLILRDCQQFL